MVVANGVARIAERTPREMVAAQQTLAEASPGRHLLGLGLGGISQLEAMRTYLDGMDGFAVVTPKPAFQPARVLAANGPAMLNLAAERRAGAHTYKRTAHHTADARARPAPDPCLGVAQAVL